MVQKLQESKLTKFVSLQVYTNSDGHKHHKQWQETQVLVLDINGKALSKNKFTQFSSWTPFRTYIMQVVAFAKWLQSSYCMFSGFYVSCQTIPGDLHVFVHAGLPYYLKNEGKTSAWIIRLLFWVGEKQSTSLPVVKANLWWWCCAVDAESWNNSSMSTQCLTIFI